MVIADENAERNVFLKYLFKSEIGNAA